MKLHLRADEANGEHTKVTVFMNGGNCGQLCMKEKEALFFHEILMTSTWSLPKDEIISSGKWTIEPEKVEEMNFTEKNRQYENIQHDRESRRIEALEDAVEEAIEELILRHNINVVRMVEKAMGINMEDEKCTN